MKVLWHGFCGKQHSWSVCAQNICRILKKLGHNVHMFSTNGDQHFPEDLRENLIGFVNENEKILSGKLPDRDYDMQLTYTAMHNWGPFLNFGKKNRFAIWNYDGSHIPKGWAKYHNFCDLILPSSEFSKNTFLRNGVPEDKMVIVPHGVNDEFLNPGNTFDIKTDRKRKFLLNIAQIHTRKNIPMILDCWGKAFNKNDDVVLVAKLSKKKNKTMPFELFWSDLFSDFKKRYKNHAPIVVVDDFLDNISDIYRSCDISLSASHVECFHLPSLEMMSLNKLSIASNYGGNVDFMNENNSLLINGKIGRAPLNYQYWVPVVEGEMFYPDKNETINVMKTAAKDYDALLEKFQPELLKVKEKYTWENVVNQILSLVKE